MDKELILLALNNESYDKTLNKEELLDFKNHNFKLYPEVFITKENIKTCSINIDCLEDILEDNIYLKKLGAEYGIVYNYDSVKFGDIDSLLLDKDNIMEARFFSKNFEINLRYSDEDLIGNIIFDTGYENPIKEHLFVYNKNNACSNPKYNILSVNKYIAYDEDGQAYIYYVKPCEFKGKGAKKNDGR